MTIFTHVKKEDVERLKSICKLSPKTLYEEFRCSLDGVTLILYASGKLLLQGKKEDVKKVAGKIKKLGIGKEEKSEIFRKEEGWMIGSDESLKGDTFGGITVAAVKADEKMRQELISLGVADSKTLSDEEIIPLAEKIRKQFPCEVKSLFPEEYNDFLKHTGEQKGERTGESMGESAEKGKKKSGVTALLNKLHKECAQYLEPGKHVVDKYPGCVVGSIREERAESKYVEVAAASILARAAALQQLNALSREAGFSLPKGSTHVKDALFELKESGLEFRRFVKVDFANVREFL